MGVAGSLIRNNVLMLATLHLLGKIDLHLLQKMANEQLVQQNQHLLYTRNSILHKTFLLGVSYLDFYAVKSHTSLLDHPAIQRFGNTLL